MVITAGLSRKPGMNRQDLLSKNAQIMKAICSQLKERHLDNTIFIVVSNPLDAMVYLAGKELQLPRERIIGMAGVLDTARFKTFIAKELNVSVEDISAMVLGGHGDSMVPLIRLCTVGGVPLEQLMDKKTLAQIVERTKKGGGEIVGLLKTGSAFYAPSLSVVQMVEAILLDKKRVLPCAALLQGEYGAEDIFAGVPCLLGGQGMEKILEISLSEEEREQFKNSLAAVKKTLSELEQAGGLMSLQEYQVKALFKEYGIPVQASKTASTVQEAVSAAQALSGNLVGCKSSSVSRGAWQSRWY